MKKNGYIHQLRDQSYYIEILLYNQIEGEQPLSVPFFYVDSLAINESLQQWPTSGFIVFNTPFEIFSRGNPTNPKRETDSNYNVSKVKAPYIDRSDGRNRLSIKIYPVETNDKDIKESKTKYPSDKWEMAFDFVITDIQDLPTPNAQIKKRKYIFIDERYQILKERNLEWSSGQIVSKTSTKKPYQMTDLEKSVNPNLLLKELIKLAGTNPSTTMNSNDLVYVGFGKSGTIDKPNIPFANFEETRWDSGIGSNKIPYYSSAKHTALDDMEELLSYCVSSEGGPVILDFGRYTDDKKWHLIPVSKFFKEASAEQIEHLILESSSGFADTATPRISRGPTDTGNLMSAIASRIQKYSFSPMVAVDDNRITNSAIHYYDHSTGTFHIKIEKNTTDNVVKTLESYAKAGLYSFKKGRNAQILINQNKTKQTGLMFQNNQSYNGSFIFDGATHNEMLLDAIFLNQSISFQTYGLTLRAPGRFMFIDNIDSGDTNPFDDRFLGQWMITKVSHLFTQETYLNEVVGVKIDSFDKVFNKKDEKM
jgi:hypothetical protein